MHELAIADSVVRIACAHAAGRRVARVELKVGWLRQVVPSALEFSFGLVAEGTELEGAELVIEVVPAGGRCRAAPTARCRRSRCAAGPAAGSTWKCSGARSSWWTPWRSKRKQRWSRMEE